MVHLKNDDCWLTAGSQSTVTLNFKGSQMHATLSHPLFLPPHSPHFLFRLFLKHVSVLGIWTIDVFLEDHPF